MNGGNVSVYHSGDFGPGQPPLDDRTMFQIGSLTKTFTATLLASMVLDGRVKLDQAVQSVAPQGVRIPSYGGQAITFANLAEHNSGLPRLPTNLPGDLNDPYAAYTPALFAQFLSTYTLPQAPGQKYEYSNVGAGLLGDALAWSAGKSYGELLRSSVLSPLALNDTTITLTPDQQVRLAPGLTDAGTAAPPWHMGELAGAGALYSDMHDMLAYLQANMTAPSGPLGAAMAMAQTPRVPAGPPHGETKSGLIWVVNAGMGNTFMNGETGGYHSFMLFNRDANIGIVLLANVADANVDTLAWHVLYPAVVAAPVSSAAQANSLPEDPANAALARGWLQSLRAGTIDRSKLTPEFSQHVTDDLVRQISASLTTAGELSGWTFLSAQKQGDVTVYRYRVSIGTQTHVWTVMFDEKGRIAGSLLQ